MKVHNLLGKVPRRLIPSFLTLVQRKDPENTRSKEEFREVIVELVDILNVIADTTQPMVELGGPEAYRTILLAQYNEMVCLRDFLMRCSSTMRSAHGPSVMTMSMNDIIAKASEAVDVGTLEMYIHLETMIAASAKLLSIPL
jgi:hypothetical protein